MNIAGIWACSPIKWGCVDFGYPLRLMVCMQAHGRFSTGITEKERGGQTTSFTIKGERSQHEEKNGDSTLTACRFGSFSRAKRLPLEAIGVDLPRRNPDAHALLLT